MGKRDWREKPETADEKQARKELGERRFRAKRVRRQIAEASRRANR